ncbi:MAG: cob(I)yrinic acid a,c-diamide adenosyltransferase [bacterium]
MLYTRQGDSGATFTCPAGSRVSKRSKLIEALGALDEINSWLGFCKARLPEEVGSLKDIIHGLQEDLFIVQAELAGADKTITADKVKRMEVLTDQIEQQLPKINTFFIAGETEISASLDVARALARRAERRVVDAVEAGEAQVGNDTKAFLNRLSSVLYVLVRFANHKLGVTEKSPTYR